LCLSRCADYVQVRELADMLFATAVQHAKQAEYPRAMQLLLEAADTFTTRGFHKRAHDCLSLVQHVSSECCSDGRQASVIALQHKQTRQKLLFLSREEARSVIAQQMVFADALVLAAHYDLNVLAEWVAYVFCFS